MLELEHLTNYERARHSEKGELLVKYFCKIDDTMIKLEVSFLTKVFGGDDNYICLADQLLRIPKAWHLVRTIPWRFDTLIGDSVKWKFNSLQRQAEHSNLQSFDLTYKHKLYVTYSIRLQMCAYVNWSQQKLGLKI